jgi:hypothetical protein
VFLTFQSTNKAQSDKPEPVYVDVDKVCYIARHPFTKDKTKIGFGYGSVDVDGGPKEIRAKIISARKRSTNAS